MLSVSLQVYDCFDYVTLHWATLNRATVKRRHFKNDN